MLDKAIVSDSRFQNTTIPDFSTWAHKVISNPRYSLEGTAVANLAEALRQSFDQGFVYGKRVGYELGSAYPSYAISEE